ncbi:helix-turn-helix transcriptional regulator [Chrysiogenes arsenatis]|uniref:helix-turn-helix transcriptional regulator n=1 Tax=Chrysiogenes arsenatis TaxID=309797 RepID=UPI00040950F7|nr:helix-turn-helix transcriptional regulator [Chrysiogenes arsenatis]
MKFKAIPIHPLYEYRITRNMTQADLSDLLHVSRAHISAIERGIHYPSLKLAQVIEQVTSGFVSAEACFAFADAMNAKPSKR